MKLEVKRTTRIEALKEDFMDHFDGLKIEFFHHSHAHEQGSPKKDMVKDNVCLEDLNNALPEQTLEITGEMTVNQVEDLFENDLGLHIQVFRKMNVSWIETTATDSYTLDHQVKMSKESRGY